MASGGRGDGGGVANKNWLTFIDDLRIDYSHPAEPPLSAEDAAWAATLIAQQAMEES
jgi:hypothetical protein